MTEREQRFRALAAMLSVGGVNIPIQKFEFKIDYWGKFGVIAPDKKLLILPLVT